MVELYETAIFDLKTALLGGGNRTASSWALPELEVRSCGNLGSQ